MSYTRLLEITNEIGTAVCSRFAEEQVVCPPKLRTGIFTTAAADNIDHNPGSVTAADSFHGTAVSLMQHVTKECQGTDRPKINLTTKESSELPTSYASVPPFSLKTKEQLRVPKTNHELQMAEIERNAKLDEQEWLGAVIEALKKEETSNCEQKWLSWSAYHASQSEGPGPLPALVALLPLFYENAHSAAMMKHAMDITRTCTQFLNPGQVPVMTVDQPLFALVKQIQWTLPGYGEDRFVVMFGGLHIEMAILRVSSIQNKE